MVADGGVYIVATAIAVGEGLDSISQPIMILMAS